MHKVSDSFAFNKRFSICFRCFFWSAQIPPKDGGLEQIEKPNDKKTPRDCFPIPDSSGIHVFFGRG